MAGGRDARSAAAAEARPRAAMTETSSASRIQAILGQLLLGLVNGSFYAMLSLAWR